MTNIAVIGAGSVGLSVCASLIERGHQVHLYDPRAPGEGASFGNAGMIANYVTDPLASMATLRSLPRELTRADASLSIDPRYALPLMGFGRRFLSAATPTRFARNKADLLSLIKNSVTAQHALLDTLDAPTLFADSGCLQIVRNDASAAQGIEQAAANKRRDGLDCRALTAEEVRELEPELAAKGLEGALYFPATRHLKNPLAVTRTLYQCLVSQGLHFHRAEVTQLSAQRDGGWQLSVNYPDIDSADAGSGKAHVEQVQVDQVVLCAGMVNNRLLKALNIKLPVVSERGYHIRLETPVALTRPVGWLAHHFYATPMEGGVRMAGTTEFKTANALPDERRWEQLRQWGGELFGQPVTLGESWFGVRHSTPDGLPAIGELAEHQGLYLAYGHGHLGLTLSAHTGQLIADMVDGNELPQYAANLSPDRFTGSKR
ncbi:FAD-dependent oxidoreductase [Halomonas sp. PAMB 3264]|uniref:NAD(P)/FAD-dependent oxidoreductase n=1 Tax=unclassified Halomonas TaxID=2609666 RepID=UPI00289EB677|nr:MULTISPECIES: FAD-dependent oxidoreductase [unclassified Halomonas]WNL38096.1 FAD-dependent oxidoreductase [Halomonas sp. PAMB 3232]WNL41422.1 FAD-dependent oxidoreductase [Halomonas sp. PAMB 3264]